jgi:hypothetical protein
MRSEGPSGPILAAETVEMSVRSLSDAKFDFAVPRSRLWRRLVTTTGAMPRHIAYQVPRARISMAANLEESKSAYSRRTLPQRLRAAASGLLSPASDRGGSASVLWPSGSNLP